MVLGAGLSGLVAARNLAASGHQVVVIEQGGSVGGRLATTQIGDATLDDGAQFFTVRGEDFRSFVEPLIEADLIFEWCDGFDDPPDGYPRFATTGGMSALAQHLSAGLDIRTGVQATALGRTDSGWSVTWDGGSLDASALIATPPVPQTLALLDAGAAGVDATMSGLHDIAYQPTLAALVVLDGPSALPRPGGRQLDDGAFTFVADNRLKGISSTTAVTLHSDHDLARDRWEDRDEAVLSDLIEAGCAWLGDSPVLGARLHKWNYAGPVEVWPQACAVAVDGEAPLLLAGDAFDGPKVEGAFRSGLAAARELYDRLAG